RSSPRKQRTCLPVLGSHRSLAASFDPAPCSGDDLASDDIGLILWRAEDVPTITARAELMAPAIGADANHLFEWCSAFAAMTALELAESPNTSAQQVE